MQTEWVVKEPAQPSSHTRANRHREIARLSAPAERNCLFPIVDPPMLLLPEPPNREPTSGRTRTETSINGCPKKEYLAIVLPARAVKHGPAGKHFRFRAGTASPNITV